MIQGYSEWMEYQANVLFANVAGFEMRTLERIGKRIKKYGRMSLADIKTVNNIAVVKEDMDAIVKDLAQMTDKNIREIYNIYGQAIDMMHSENRELYDYRGKTFVPFKDNRELQALVRAYAKDTGGTMINLAKTTMLGFTDKSGKFSHLQKAYTDVLDKAVMSLSSGSAGFYTAMRDSIVTLGGSGLRTRVQYDKITRRLDTVVRQHLLWGAKQASNEYNEMIGDELGCDGIEIDWHSNPRPSHEFMQGKQYALGGAKTVNGIKFESAGPALEALQDYGCLHYKMSIICGVSEPRYDADELARLNAQNSKTYEIGDKKMTGYEASQAMRRLETEVRRQKDIREIARASGDKVTVRNCNERIKAIKGKYTEISTITGIPEEPRRMSKPRVLKDDKLLTNSDSGGIINAYSGKGIEVKTNIQVSEETKQRVFDATKKITSDFKILEEYSEPIIFGNVKNGLAQNNYNPATGKNQIILSRETFTDTKKLLEILKDDYESGKSFDTDFIESLVAHEMGHNAHIALALKRANIPYGKPLSALERQLLKKHYDEISQEIYTQCFTNESFDEIQNQCAIELGDNAYGNPRELIAQSFGNYYFGKHKSNIGKKIVKYFMEGLK